MKFLTRGEAESKRRKAIDFLRHIGHDDDAARFDWRPPTMPSTRVPNFLENPTGRKARMKRTTSRSELEAERDSAKGYIEELAEKLDNIAGIASAPRITRKTDKSEQGVLRECQSFLRSR